MGCGCRPWHARPRRIGAHHTTSLTVDLAIDSGLDPDRVARYRHAVDVDPAPGTPSKTRGSRSGATEPEGTGGFLGQVGLFESANGLPHGPIAIVLAIAVALIVYPISRLAGWATRR